MLLKPEDYAGHLALAEEYQNNRQTAQAIKEYVRPCGWRPKEQSFIPCYNLGLLYARQGDFPAAASQLKSALAVTRRLPGPERALAWVHLKANNLPDAAHVPEGDPGICGPGIRHANLGIVEDRLGHTELAIREYKKEALRLNPKDTQSRALLGSAYLTRERFQDALAEFKSVVGPDPKDATAYNNLGYAQEKGREAGRRHCRLQEGGRGQSEPGGCLEQPGRRLRAPGEQGRGPQVLPEGPDHRSRLQRPARNLNRLKDR